MQLPKELAARWVRTDVYWDQVERPEGRFNWSRRDIVVSGAEKAGVNLLFFVSDYCPGIMRHSPYSSSGEAKLRAYENFLRGMVQRYKGKVRYWEIENEVTHEESWICPLDVYIKVLKVAYSAIKAEDPAAQVVLAGFASEELAIHLAAISDPRDPRYPAQVREWARRKVEDYQYIIQQAWGYFDILSVHLYQAPESIPQRIDWFRQQMAPLGGHKPIWVTETGGPDEADPRYVVADPPLEAQEAEVVKRYVLAFAAGADRVFWHNVWQSEIRQDTRFSRMALNHDQERTAAFYTYQLMVNKLQGFTAVVNLDLGAGISAYRFSRPSGDVYVLWADKETVVKLPIKAGRVTVTSTVGTSVQANSESLPVTTGPVFVEATTAPSPSQTATAVPMPTPTSTATPTPQPTATLRSLGTLKQVADVECPGGPCKTAVVTCSGIGVATVKLRLTGAGTGGTILLFSGGDGTGWYDTTLLRTTLLDDGYKLVEIAWMPPGVWEGPGGSVSLACRAATVIDWVRKNIHRGGLFILQGGSGGSAQIAFSLAYYGLDEGVNLANLSGGPPPCPISTGGRLNGGDQEQRRCLVGLRDWDRSKEPMLSGQPRLHYPNTAVRFFLGENEPTPYIVETAKAYHDAITSEKSLQIIPNTGHGVHQTREGAAALIASIRQARSTLSQAP